VTPTAVVRDRVLELHERAHSLHISTIEDGAASRVPRTNPARTYNVDATTIGWLLGDQS
jgi:hypothetical protein